MRIGQNPEKKNYREIEYRRHRIIIPVYIPETNQEYFEGLFEVLKTSLNSLFLTINREGTAITIINNACKPEVSVYLDALLLNSKIDKLVKLSKNIGKVSTVVSEAKSSYEALITIADADVFYFNNWENEVIKIFNTFPNTGVVAPLPMPNLTFYHNTSLWATLFFKIKKEKIVSDKSFQLFEEGIGNETIFETKKTNWKKSQYILSKNEVKACLGAGHFIATYRREVFDKLPFKKPKYVFKNGDEEFFLDQPIDKLGFYRLSTIDTFVYHLGNNIPKWVSLYQHQVPGNIQEIKDFNKNKKGFFTFIDLPYRVVVWGVLMIPYKIKIKLVSLIKKMNL